MMSKVVTYHGANDNYCKICRRSVPDARAWRHTDETAFDFIVKDYENK